MLSVANLKKTYLKDGQAIHALEEVSLELTAGEFVAVKGPSGCGKTTLLLMAGGLLRPDGGRVEVDGQDPYAMTPERRAEFRAETVGFVFQRFHLIPYLSVLENVLTPSLAMDSDEACGRAQRLIEHFGLGDRIHHKPAELSTGERQRVALGRAVMNGPKLLLADEPTGNLDGENAETVLAYLAEFAESGGAVLLVTHDVRAAEYAGRFVELREGRVVGAGDNASNATE